MTEANFRILPRSRSVADNIITIQHIAAILEYDCGLIHTHAEQLASAVVNRAMDLELPHIARFIAAEQVWRRTICDEAEKASLVTGAEPHTRIKLLNDVALVDLEMERVYEDRADIHEIVRAKVHLKAHHDDLELRSVGHTLGDKLREAQP